MIMDILKLTLGDPQTLIPILEFGSRVESNRSTIGADIKAPFDTESNQKVQEKPSKLSS